MSRKRSPRPRSQRTSARSRRRGCAPSPGRRARGSRGACRPGTPPRCTARGRSAASRSSSSTTSRRSSSAAVGEPDRPGGERGVAARPRARRPSRARARARRCSRAACAAHMPAFPAPATMTSQPHAPWVIPGSSARGKRLPGMGHACRHRRAARGCRRRRDRACPAARRATTHRKPYPNRQLADHGPGRPRRRLGHDRARVPGGVARREARRRHRGLQRRGRGRHARALPARLQGLRRPVPADDDRAGHARRDRDQPLRRHARRARRRSPR